MLSRVACRRDASTHVRPRLGRKGLLLFSATPRLPSQVARPTSTINPSSASPRELTRGPPFIASRNLATTADPTGIDQESFSNPFTDSPYTVGSSGSDFHQWKASSLFPQSSDSLDPTSLVIVRDNLETKPKVVRRQQGIGGGEDEMLANLDMSLRVGRFDRAATLITRLGQFYPVGSPAYLSIHNRLLEAMVLHMIVTRQHQMIPSLQRWFEFDMPNEGVHPDAATLAIMVKMCLRMMHGPRRDRAVRKYWELAKKQDAEEDLLCHSMLGELELGELSEVRCSHQFVLITKGGWGRARGKS